MESIELYYKQLLIGELVQVPFKSYLPSSQQLANSDER